MQTRINTDLAGGIAVLVIGIFFQAQITEDLTPYGAFFPQKILWLLFLCGSALLVRGLVHMRTESKIVFRLNGDMLVAIMTGGLWAVFLDWFGFIASGSIALSVLCIRYLPSGKRSLAAFVANCLGAVMCVLLFYWLFTGFLGVTLPTGRMIDAFRI